MATENNNFADLKIECNSAFGGNGKVFLNGEDISRFTRAVSVNIDCGKPVTAFLEIYVGSLDVNTKAII
jgi:hypothetical protein